MRIVVTGSSGRLAAALLPSLCERASVERVTGIDVGAPRYTHPKFHALRCDIRSDDAWRALAGHDALVHLACVVLRGRMPLDVMADVNVDGAHRLLLAAAQAGVRRLVVVSSAAVYGSGRALTEDAPLRPLAGFAYAEHKARLEALIARDLPQCVRLRPHVVLGPHAQPLLRRLLRQPCYPRLPQPCPRLQCVHEDDVAQAVVNALASDARGPYNLAAEGDFTFRDAIRRGHPYAVAVPLVAARAAVAVAWRTTGWGGEPAWVDGLAATLTLDCTRARRELGWRPAHDAASTLASAARAARRSGAAGA